MTDTDAAGRALGARPARQQPATVAPGDRICETHAVIGDTHVPIHGTTENERAPRASADDHA